MVRSNKLRAYREGKLVFYIPSLARTVFAKSLAQCQSKFTGHRVVELRNKEKLSYIFS
jgi:Mor family transcriptional regulator